MFDLSAAGRLARRLFHRRAGRSAGDSGRLTVATGLAAVGAVESAIGDPPVTRGDGRGQLAAAFGLAAGGGRASVVLSGAALVTSVDLLAEATRQRLPLVVHLVAGGDHGAYHAATASGAALLFATNAQEAADWTLIARRLAEDALTPVVVAMDGAETALAAQDLRLPEVAAIERFAGRPGDVVHPPTPSQEMIFGRHRRRMPRWHDPHRPLLHGAMPGPESLTPVSAARKVYFDAHVPVLLATATDAFEAETGRRLEPLRTARVDGARFLLVAQGAAVETAEAVAARLSSRKLAVGVVGLRTLRPFPAEPLAELLRNRRGVMVLERAGATTAQTPLLAEIRSLAADGPLPPLTSVLYGFGGYPLRAGDLAAAVRRLASGDAKPKIYLGLDPDAATAAYPKRQALRDGLARAYPEIAESGLRSEEDALAVLPEDGLTVTLHRLAGRGGGPGLEVATLLHRLLGGHLRSRLAGAARSWGMESVETVTVAPSPLKDPGDGVASDLAVYLGGAGKLARVKDGGSILLLGDARPEGLSLAVAERDVKVYAASAESDEDCLGALAGVLGLESRDVSLRQLLAARREMLEGGNGDGDVERRLDELQSGFESVRRLEAGDLEDAVAPDARAEGPPPAVRRLGRSEAALADLPGFWDRTGVLYRDGEAAGLWPEPFLATRTMPPCSSALRDLSPARTVLPAFDPELCTGCGACWSACPDSAVTAVTVEPRTLIDHGMKRAAAAGHSVDKLRMITGKLASRVAKQAAGDWHGGPAGPLFDVAFDATLAAMKLPEEREAGVRAAYAAVREVAGELPLARTAPFFDSANDGGELLAVAVDPDACKGCELCVAACEPGALTAAADDPRRTSDARALQRLCEELPDPGDATLERARRHPDVGPLAGTLLSREARQVMAGGHGAEAGSGSALALRQILGVAAYHLRPTLEAQLKEVSELKSRLSAAIHDTLAGALPDRDLDALARGLDGLTGPEAEIAELTERVESAFETERVDVTRTRRLVAAARRLADLEWHLETGESGLGRAPFGLVLDGAALPWAAAYPHHPFRVPVTVAAGEAVAVARGLVAGRRRDAEQIAGALRRARLELDRSAPSRASGDAGAPAWDDLSGEERAYCPPLFVVTTRDALMRTPPAAFDGLADAALPLLVIVLDESLESRSGVSGEALSALTGLPVAESTVAHFDPLERAVTVALDGGGPSLLRVLAPSPARCDVAPSELFAAVRRQLDSGAYALSLSDEATAVEPATGTGGAPEGNGQGDAAALQTLRQRHATELAELRRDYESRLANQEASFRVRMARQIRERLMRLVEAGRR